MTVFVNDKEFYLAPGMTVRHAVIAAGFLDNVMNGQKVFDEWGNETGLDGGVSENCRIYIGDKK